MSEEKNFEGKVLSSSSDDTEDINEEIIINDIIDDDIKEVIVNTPKKKKRSKTKICKTCGQDILKNEISNSFMYKDTYHQLRVKNYCKEHEETYRGHKCKPSWCGDCDYLIKYEIEIQEGK